MTVSNEKDSQVVSDVKSDGEQMEYATYDGPEMPASLKALSPEEYRKVGIKATFKIDIIVMPILMMMYILNYLDRQNIAAAKLAGIEEDLGLTDVQYQVSSPKP